MRAKLIGIGIVVVLAGLGLGFRFIQLMPYPKGEFNWVDSPNARHRAYVSTLTDMKFFTPERKVYRMKVEAGLPQGGRIVIFEQDVLQGAATKNVDLSKLDEVVSWTPDSTRAVYKLGADPVTVEVPLL